ncbi:MAG: hypothetical protein LBH01_11860 [Verrucomicrobiales bacterium]|jgi:hypothetical protein|nr:hypothetical protein [Verrucomicrobiales bacterium]
MAAVVDTEWNIKTRSSVCQATGRPFVEDEVFHTILLDRPEGLERLDWSEEAWQNNPSPEWMLSCWKSVFKPDPPAPVEAVTREDAESELRRLLENLQPEDEKCAYLLALLLERKRILKARQKIDSNGHKCVVYEHAVTQETLIVPEVDFKLSDMDSLINEMNQNGGMVFRVNMPAGLVPEGGEGAAE